jgi:adenine phosphoribosyltransferase
MCRQRDYYWLESHLYVPYPMTTYRIQIGSVVRDLPLREVAPGVTVALFDILGDWELTEAAGRELAKLVHKDIEALVMPEGKATALLHVVGRETGLPTYVARKEHKPYMAQPVTFASVKSITTARVQTLCVGADVAKALTGKSVAFVDDVVSSGGTLNAMIEILSHVGARHEATLAIFTEGTQRMNVQSLGHLPLF